MSVRNSTNFMCHILKVSSHSHVLTLQPELLNHINSPLHMWEKNQTCRRNVRWKSNGKWRFLFFLRMVNKCQDKARERPRLIYMGGTIQVCCQSKRSGPHVSISFSLFFQQRHRKCFCKPFKTHNSLWTSFTRRVCSHLVGSFSQSGRCLRPNMINNYNCEKLNKLNRERQGLEHKVSLSDMTGIVNAMQLLICNCIFVCKK